MTVNLELYGAPTGNCFRVAIALEESGLPFAVRRVDLRQGAHQDSGFLRLNPAGKVPVLVDRRDGPDLVLSQSNAIMLHLAATASERLMPFEQADMLARFYERLFYFITDVIAPSHAAFLLRSTGDEGGARTLLRRSTVNLMAARRFLDGDGYMLGDRFSLVDIAAVTIATASRDDIDWSAVPRLREWFERVASRPAVIRGFQTFA
ncbi:MAG TPA: glutathione S-transferase family protein [Novosphingobium sp.]|nr:glutathione S-transferase family protein [Novosphingobium sp.]